MEACCSQEGNNPDIGGGIKFLIAFRFPLYQQHL